MTDLILVLEDFVLFSISDQSTAKGVWDKLENMHGEKHMSNIIFLRGQVYSLRMKDGYSLQERLNEFNTLVSRLAFVGIKTKEEENVQLLF